MYRNAVRITFWLAFVGLLMSSNLFTAISMAYCMGVCMFLAYLNVRKARA